MKVGHDLLVRAQHLQQTLVQIARFEARNPQPAQTWHARTECFNQLSEWLGSGAGLAAAEGGWLTICAEEDPRQYDLDMPGVNQRSRFVDRRVERFAPQRRTQGGNDAVGAMGIAPILD